MSRILKVLFIFLLALDASLLHAAENRLKRELSAKIANLIDAYIAEELQRQQVAAAPLPAVASTSPMLEGTETKVLIECMGTREMLPYFNFVKNQKTDRINTFVDGLLAENGPFLDAIVSTGGGDWGPVDLTRDALKTALGEKVRGVAISIPAPAAGSIKSLYSYHTEVEQEIAQVVEEYINLFAPGGDAGNFLAEGVNQPEYRSRFKFKNAIKDTILR